MDVDEDLGQDMYEDMGHGYGSGFGSQARIVEAFSQGHARCPSTYQPSTSTSHRSGSPGT